MRVEIELKSGNLHMMRMIMAAAVAGLLSSTAFAADLTPTSPSYDPAATAYDWSGAYVGFVAGYLLAEGEHQAPPGFGTRPPYDVDGAMVGGTVGYNWQKGSIIYGVEGDFSLADMSGNVVLPANFRTDIRNFGTLRARMGYTYDRVMPYVTGGVAFADIHAGQFGTLSVTRDWVAGWTLGAGVETALSDKVTFKLEGLYVDLGDITYTSLGNPIDVTTEGVGVVRVGLNRRF
ncbi:porin family protein [Pseudohoeflea suaedae]|uniref:Porin family protein n=1 Tax=Pseudohoeflea suaedae TaxID=877384 RepID=A0A4R5PMJ6_9HYPH|nr:outer membrane protein [Pseudohoeflea suaedae]TDH38220.1 porin family protein [Pseudohoeflea suaedae]